MRKLPPFIRRLLPTIDEEFIEKRGKPLLTSGVLLAIIICWVVAFLAPSILLIVIVIGCTIAGALAILRILRGPLDSDEDEDGLPSPIPSKRVQRALAKNKKAEFKDEELLWESREHPISMWLWGVGVALLQPAAIWAVTVNWQAAAILWTAGMLAFGGRLWIWDVNRICVTNKRLLVVSGIVNIQYKTMPLSKLTDQTAGFPPVSNILAWLRIIKTQYATLIVESAGQEQALNKVLYVPEGHRVNRLIMSMVL